MSHEAQIGCIDIPSCGGTNNGISNFAKVNTVMPLSEAAIKNVKPNPDKAFKLPDEKGTYLLVQPNGSKYFRLDYKKNVFLGV
ncbi:MAG: Arm DNA-binding domain-containing protein [Gammaproteobacteria bacterium]